MKNSITNKTLSKAQRKKKKSENLTEKNSRKGSDQELDPLMVWVASLLERFISLREIIVLVKNLLLITENSQMASERKIAKRLIKEACARLEKTMPEWRVRLDLIFKGKYPCSSVEVIYCNALAAERYRSSKLFTINTKPTFRTKSYEIVGAPSSLILQQIAPKLFEVVKAGCGYVLEETANATRLKRLSKKNVASSALIEVVCPSRPLYRLSKSIEMLKNGVVRRTEVPSLCSKGSPEGTALKDWANDLEKAFGWASRESFANYLAYVCQPLLIHLCPGGNAMFYFGGPSGSGKTALAKEIPLMLYCGENQETVVESRIPRDTHQFQIFLSKLTEAVYVVFDEIVDATEEQLKNLDQLATATQLTFRKLHRGFGTLENHLTVGLTSVSFEFSPETKRRLANVELTSLKNEEVQGFFQKWQSRNDEVFADLVQSVNSVDFDEKLLPVYGGRPRGFGLLGHFVFEIFGVRPSFELKDNEIDVLSRIVEAYELGNLKGTLRGKYLDCSMAAILAGLQATCPSYLSKGQVEVMLREALPAGGNTQNDSEKKEGVPGPSGDRYHIRYVPRQNKNRARLEIRSVDGSVLVSQLVESTNSTKSTQLQ